MVEKTNFRTKSCIVCLKNELLIDNRLANFKFYVKYKKSFIHNWNYTSVKKFFSRNLDCENGCKNKFWLTNAINLINLKNFRKKILHWRGKSKIKFSFSFDKKTAKILKAWFLALEILVIIPLIDLKFKPFGSRVKFEGSAFLTKFPR